MHIKFIPIILPFFLLSCEKKEGGSPQEQIKQIKMSEMSKEIYLPTEMWDRVTGGSFEKAVQQSVSFNFTSIQLILKERSEGVLTDSEIRFEFPNGGGEIDLSKYVQNTKGTFQVKFGFDGFDYKDDLQIYYISKGKKRRIEQEIYGSGCNSFYDLKDYVLKVNAKEGIEVNVTRDRHVSVLAGHFVFAYKKDKQTFLSQVTFADSKRPDLFCEEDRQNKKKDI